LYKIRMVKDTYAKISISLRRRFQQNQEDVAYTVMALLPTLSEHILGEMDVESITHELQSMSKTSRLRPPIPIRLEPQALPTPSVSSLASSVEMLHHDQDARSDQGSGMSESAYGGEDYLPESRVESVSSPSPSRQNAALSPALTGSPAHNSPDLTSGVPLSDSIITTNSSIMGYNNPESSNVSAVTVLSTYIGRQFTFRSFSCLKHLAPVQ
jgi:peroxin-3